MTRADAKCRNCWRDFADHDYVKDSVSHGMKWKCPHPRVETGYGAYKCGDPRLFHPDHEASTSAERELHRVACEAWDEAEINGEPSPAIDKRARMGFTGCCGTIYGVGVYQFHYEQFFEEHEEEEVCE